METPLNALARHAVVADLIVIGDMPADTADICRRVSVGDAIMQAGRPVLRIPSGGMALEPETIVIAWKNTREARRAVADALPFLHRAEKVLIVADRQDARLVGESLDDVSAYLLRRGIVASWVTLPGQGSAGESILAAAAHAGADLIVAGGYGHSRLEEWAFGGVTKTLLDHAPIPVLFSH